MKRIVAVIALTICLLMLFSCVGSVMAESPKKLPAALSTSGVVNDETDAKKIINPDGTIHVWGAKRTATATLKIGAAGPSQKVYSNGQVEVNLDFIIYPDMTTTQHYHKFVITFPAQTGLPNGGIFEGVNTWKADMTDFPKYYAATFECHYTLQGSGDFEGYTLHVDKDVGGVTQASWVLIH